MPDTRDLLKEAVGSYEPRGDERAVERRVERHRRSRRVSSGVVALGVFAAAGWLAWTALGPRDGTIGSTGSGTYVLSDFEVEPHREPATNQAEPGQGEPGQADPGQADVTFVIRWSDDEYPGVHRCTVRVVASSGMEIGSRSLEISTLSPEDSLTTVVPVGGSIEGATATGSCAARRLDAPIAAVISNEHFEYVAGRLSVVFDVEPPDGRIGAQSCTSAVWDADGLLLGSVSFTASLSEGTRHAGLGVDEAIARAEAASATLICEPYVHENQFPDPEPPGTEPAPSDRP